MADIRVYADALSAVHTTAKYAVGEVFTAPGSKKYVYGKIRLGTAAATTPRNSWVVPIRGSVATSAWTRGEFTTSISYCRKHLQGLGGVCQGRVVTTNSYCLVQVGGPATPYVATSQPAVLGARFQLGIANKALRRIAAGSTQKIVGIFTAPLTTGTSTAAQLITQGKKSTVTLYGDNWF
jgi:hypothetical protein